MGNESKTMTPILFGRWQTRIFLLATVGVVFTLPFALGYLGPGASSIYFWVLFYVGLLGIVWDILYDGLQKFLWDHDWPGVLQFFASLTEGIVLALLIQTNWLPYLSSLDFNLLWFILHYSCVSIAVYLSSWVVMRILFPRWRFRGGIWIGRWPRR
jgi:hypothetical protein